MVDAELALQPDPMRYTLPRFLDNVCARGGDCCALVDARGRWSYAELHEAARGVARGLVAAGVSRGERVGLLMSNRREWVASFFGAALAGGVVVPLNTLATPDELDYVLQHADVATLLLQPVLLGHRYLDDLLARHGALRSGAPGAIRCAALPCLRRIFVLEQCAEATGAPAPGGQGDGASSRGAASPWSVLEAGAGDVDDALLEACADAVDPSDDALIIYTSGTTSRPKGVVHRQRAPVIQSWRFAEHMALTADDRVWTAQPFFWTAGICMSLGATLAAGASLVVDDHFDPGRALERIEQLRPTALHAWPHQEKAMAEHPEASRRDLASVRYIEFSSPLAARAGIERNEWGIYCSYGLTETFTICAALPSWTPAEVRASTNGVPLPGMEIRIVDPHTGLPLAPGEKGEIAVRGLTLMRGYQKVAPELCFDSDGFYRTQDAGLLDEQGRLHWSGRLSNLIKTGGANVSPLEIEHALAELPGVTSATAVGVPHPTLGEAIVLCAVPAPGAAPQADDIQQRLAARLAAYKRPRHVLFFDAAEVATTGTQKIQVAELRDAALLRLEAEGIEIAGHRYGG